MYRTPPNLFLEKYVFKIFHHKCDEIFFFSINSLFILNLLLINWGIRLKYVIQAPEGMYSLIQQSIHLLFYEFV